MVEDEFSGEKSVLPQEPTAADYHPAVNWFRAVAAIGLVYGTLGLAALPFGLLKFHQGAIAGGFRVPIMDEPVVSVSLHGMWLLISSLVGAGLAMALMIGSLGGVLLKSWSIVVLRLWAIVSVVFGVLGSFFYVQWLFSAERARMADVRGVDDVLVNFAGWAVGTCLAVAMLIVSDRRGVRETVEGS